MTLATSQALPAGRIPRTLSRDERVRLLVEASRHVRRKELEMVRAAGVGHIGDLPDLLVGENAKRGTTAVRAGLDKEFGLSARRDPDYTAPIETSGI